MPANDFLVVRGTQPIAKDGRKYININSEQKLDDSRAARPSAHQRIDAHKRAARNIAMYEARACSLYGSVRDANAC